MRASASSGSCAFRFEDRDTRIEGDPVLAGITERHASLVDQPIDDGPVHDHIDGILGDRCDRVVKRDIRVLKARTCSSHQAHRSGGGHPLLWRCALRHAPSRPHRGRLLRHWLVFPLDDKVEDRVAESIRARGAAVEIGPHRLLLGVEAKTAAPLAIG